MIGSVDAEVSAVRRIRRQNIPWDSPHQGQSPLYHGSLESPEVVMAINIAQKRARKAQRRKHVVAQKRRAEEQEASLPVRVQRAVAALMRTARSDDCVPFGSVQFSRFLKRKYSFRSPV
jgi:hypothetical protein